MTLHVYFKLFYVNVKSICKMKVKFPIGLLAPIENDENTFIISPFFKQYLRTQCNLNS